jgi:hypothetical protein
MNIQLTENPAMQKVATPFLLSISVLLIATAARALEGRFDRPTYKRIARLDFCQQLGKHCGQPAADDYCRVQGYQRATKFETEHASPTRVIYFGQECTGPICMAFKYIVCFTSDPKRGEARAWPHPMD